jgi:Family of unknown function (DUF5681)
MEEEVKNSGKNRGIENLKPFVEGESGNPDGRPKGQRNYATIYREAMLILADKNTTTPEKLEAEMVANAAVLARKGDYRFYKDFMDRLHGTAVQRTEGNNTISLNASPESKEVVEKAFGNI